MKIEFSRSGGLAAPAMRQKVEINTEQLTNSDAQELLELIGKADVANHPTETITPSPDSYYYRITVTDQGESHTRITSDADMPEDLNALVDWLTAWAAKKG